MKSNLIMTVILFLIMVFFPLITLAEDTESIPKDTTGHTTTENTSAELTQISTTAENKTETVSLLLSSTGKLTEMSTEDYVYGAVCAEMPASFHKEALKAQAVASYTYMKWLKENSDNIHPFEGDISDNSAIHQAFLTDDELKEKWGNNYNIYSEKVKEAVNEVLYQYLTYDGKTAMTVFHGLSTGKTANSSDIWKSDVPYLQSVTAPGDKLSPDIKSDVTLSREEFIKPFTDAEIKDADSIFSSIKNNDDGFVSEIKYKDMTLTATDLRSAYKLKSPFFKIENKENEIILTVYGKGHGVGMSQYSADYMARQGSTYKEILNHFYKGTELKT